MYFRESIDEQLREWLMFICRIRHQQAYFIVATFEFRIVNAMKGKNRSLSVCIELTWTDTCFPRALHISSINLVWCPGGVSAGDKSYINRLSPLHVMWNFYDCAWSFSYWSRCVLFIHMLDKDIDIERND